MAIAASILAAAYHMLKTGAEFHDLGPTHFDLADRQRTADRLRRRLQALGYHLNLEPAA